MSEFESNLVVTERRLNRRRQSGVAKSRALETVEESEEVISKEQRRQIADRRRADRRRQIDPTTCERDYSGNEIEFMRAMDDYKRKSGRPFPTWSEVLEVLMSLGYRKVAEPSQMAWRTFGDSSASQQD